MSLKQLLRWDLGPRCQPSCRREPLGSPLFPGPLEKRKLCSFNVPLVNRASNKIRQFAGNSMHTQAVGTVLWHSIVNFSDGEITTPLLGVLSYLKRTSLDPGTSRTLCVKCLVRPARSTSPAVRVSTSLPLSSLPSLPSRPT